MSAIKQKKKTDLLIFEKFQNLKKYMALKLFEFQEQFITSTFLIKLTQIEKTGSLSKVFILNSTFEKRSITFLLFDSRICLPYGKRNELNLEKNLK